MKLHLNNTYRLKVTIRGAVQGVGFRPFVFRLATELNLPGWVSNSAQGVFIEVEGEKRVLDGFVLRLQKDIPPRAFIQSLEFSFLDPIGFTSFEICESISTGAKTVLVLPDIATCPDCVRDVFDPSNRRYLYPFTNCTNCGPRFSIIESLPYDRTNTSMRLFEMCPECRREYENPLDRRFHAQPNACPVCGPWMGLWNDEGMVLSVRHDALQQAIEAIRAGKIVAIKGLGGFHLVVDARNVKAVRHLRQRKHREEKPFALMFPSLEAIKRECEVDELEKRLLLSPESPIVLLKRKQSAMLHPSSLVASSIAPNNPYLGVMLPYTPLHYILMRTLGFPIVATSGNISDEPICIDEHEAIERLRGIAELFLVHNRPIVRHVDDSIVRVMMGRELVLRRARGYAPLPISIETWHTMSLLAVGAHLKNTVALTVGENAFMSQHIGDLETKESLHAFHRVVTDFETLYETKPDLVVCDLHPDYLSSKFARKLDIPITEIQHHYAHIVSCMAENQLEGEALGVSWDGTGYGVDGTIWGGEFLLINDVSFKRVATFRSFRLPGGEKAIKEPRRTALGLLFEMLGDSLFKQNTLESLKSFTEVELEVIHQMLLKGVNSPITTSAGRLFDAVASLIGLRQHMNFEGQAAMELEFLTTQLEAGELSGIGEYRFEIGGKETSSISNSPSPIIIDWSPMISEIMIDQKKKILHPLISVKFHNTLVEMITAVAKHIGQQRVVLSGGCFQNRYLTERSVQRLQEEGFRPYWHQRVPPNDGGISLGQMYAVLHKRGKKET